MEETEVIENFIDQGTVERFGQRSNRRLVLEREPRIQKKLIKYCFWTVPNINGSSRFPVCFSSIVSVKALPDNLRLQIEVVQLQIVRRTKLEKN